MGVVIKDTYAAYGDTVDLNGSMYKNTVFNLANLGMMQVIKRNTWYSHFIVATSCPYAIAPSLGQCLNQEYHDSLQYTNTIDMVQGCAGGVSALILASQLSELNKSDVLVVTSDAAQKATSPTSDVYHVFKNGIFACCVSYSDNGTRLIHQQTRQYKDLHDVVTIGLGHDADEIIASNIGVMTTDPRKHLGLRLDNMLALKLMKEADGFYLDFITKTGHPDILVLHQVNEMIINHLEKVFSKYPIEFINVAKDTGNCGCATTGIVLHHIKNRVKNKKVMICSFGTGGVITAGLWQF